MRRSAGLLAVLVAGTVAAEPTMMTQTIPYPGIRVQFWAETGIVELHLVRIDLWSGEIGVVATAERNGGITTSELASVVGAQLAINGAMFSVPDNRPIGLAIGDESVWSGTADDCQTAVLHFGRSGGTSGERTYATIEPPDVLTNVDGLPKIRQGAISGRPLLVRNGAAVVKYDCEDPVTTPCAHAPRTAVGVSSDGHYMYFVVVDGWQPTSRGMTALELATFLAKAGAHMAFALDSGAASTLVIEDPVRGLEVVNRPSDGAERRVANHLAIKYQNLPKGVLRGFICSSDMITQCATTMPGLQIQGATVTLDDGRPAQMPSNPAEYIFPDVTPRYACVTVEKPSTGYPKQRQCRQVTANGMATYNSFHLKKNPPPLDPGPGTTQPVSGVPCEEPGGDNTAPPDDTGCCDSGDLGGSRPLRSFVLVAFVALMLTRRRGTKA